MEILATFKTINVLLVETFQADLKRFPYPDDLIFTASGKNVTDILMFREPCCKIDAMFSAVRQSEFMAIFSKHTRVVCVLP